MAQIVGVEVTYQRKEIIGDCTLYLGDCISVMREIGFVDHVITDPPYARNIYKKMRNPDSAGGNRRHVIKNGDCLSQMKADAIGSIDALLEPSAQEFGRLVQRWCIVFSDIETCHLWRQALTGNFLRYVRTGAWIKPDAMPQMTGDRPGVGFEPCTIAHAKGAMRWNGGGYPAVWTHNICRVDRPDHPCPKPLPLMRELVEQFTDYYEIVLDPFMGSGTTGVACAKTGRRFIGCEINEKFFDIACKRIEQAYAQPDMFIATPVKQEQLSMEMEAADGRHC